MKKTSDATEARRSDCDAGSVPLSDCITANSIDATLFLNREVRRATSRAAAGHACDIVSIRAGERDRLVSGNGWTNTGSQTLLCSVHAPRHLVSLDLTERFRSNAPADPNPHQLNQSAHHGGLANQMGERAHTQIGASHAHGPNPSAQSPYKIFIALCLASNTMV